MGRMENYLGSYLKICNIYMNIQLKINLSCSLSTEFALLKSSPEKIDKNRKSAEDFPSLI